ncbi:MAG: DUF2231 domain-containing protein [Rhodothalassiaceae bacterium]
MSKAIRILSGLLAALSVALALLIGVISLGPALAHPPAGQAGNPAAASTGDEAPARMPQAAGDDHDMSATMSVHEEEHAGGHEHDHAAHEHGSWARTGFERFLAWLGAFHPAATNFPIALLILAALAELLYAARGKEAHRTAARFCLWAGALAAMGTAVLGWFYAGFDPAADDPLLAGHRWNGSLVALVALLALWLGVRHWRGTGGAGPYRASLFLVAVLAGLNGYLGGRMLYGADHYDWPRAEDHAHDHDAAMPGHDQGAAENDEDPSAASED